MSYVKRTSDSTAEPVTVPEFKTYSRITLPHEDTLLGDFILEGRHYCEDYLGMAFVNQTWELGVDRFPVAMRLNPLASQPMPRPPLQSITSVVYTSSAGDSGTTMPSSDYTVDANKQPGRVAPGYNKVWPVTIRVPNSVTFTFQAGYGGTSPATTASVAAVPRLIKQAILAYAAWRYRSRDVDEKPPDTVHRLLDMSGAGLYLTWTPDEYR